MRNQFQVLNIMLDQAQELNEKGDTASAESMVQMVMAECTVILAEKLTEIEKHLAALVGRKDRPVTLEKAASKGKES